MATKTHTAIPADFPVQPIGRDVEAMDRATCGHCGLSWDDGRVTSMTPSPAARCPFEYFHVYPTVTVGQRRGRRRRVSRFVLQSVSARCPKCDWPVVLLIHGDASPRRPAFYVCFECRSVFQAGVGEVVAQPPEGDVFTRRANRRGQKKATS